ncbi:MAG: S1 RNA-binding domain-containing protein [bacterium]|nr:S1 RNA-binding domain-containing protein [bacterium]
MNEDTILADNDLPLQVSGQEALRSPKPRHPMEKLLKSIPVDPLKEGDIVDGKMMEKKGARVFIDLGSRGVGLIYGREYHNAQDIVKGLSPGDPISAKVVDVDNEDGYVELSLKEAGEERRWIDLKKIKQDGQILELPVLEANRGGLMLEAKGIKGFLPASQLSSKNYPRVEGGDKEKVYQELQKLVGQTIKVKILDFSPEENKLIFTEKELNQEAVRSALSKYKIGDEIEGEVTGVVDFGAFVKFGEAELEGLIHISEIDWALIGNPRDVLKTGEKIKAKIIDVQGDRVALSLKALKDDPWLKIEERYKKDDEVKGKVTKLNPFGAFVQLDKDFQGLAHISEFGTEDKLQEALKLGQEYTFKILLIDPKEHKMALGLVK